MEKKTTRSKLVMKLIYAFATLVMVMANFASIVPAEVSAADGAISAITVDKSTVNSGDEVTATVTADLYNAGVFGIGATAYSATVKLSGTGLTIDAAKTNTTNVAVSADGKTVTLNGNKTKSSSFDNFSAKIYLKASNDSAKEDAKATLTAQVDGQTGTKTATVTVNKLAVPTSFNNKGYQSQHDSSKMTVQVASGSTPWTAGTVWIGLEDTALAAGESLLMNFPQNDLTIDATKTLAASNLTASQLKITTDSTTGTVTLTNTSGSAIQMPPLPIALTLSGTPAPGIVVDVTRSKGSTGNFAVLTVPGTTNPLGTTVNPGSVAFQIQSAVPDTVDNPDSGNKPYAMAGQYLFSAESTDAAGHTWHAIIDNDNGTNDYASIYKGLAGVSTDFGTSSAVSLSKYTPHFLPGVQIDGTGAVVSANMPFEQGKTYTLRPYKPVSGAPTTFARQPKNLSHVYYMPDGLPTLSIVNSTEEQLDTTNANGRAIPGQWSLNSAGTGIVAKTYKVKRVKVVDQDGKAVSGVTVNFTDMRAKTGSDGTGEIVPKTWTDATSGAGAGFYWGKGTGDGTQTFQSLDAGTNSGNYYLPTNDFSLKLNTTTDQLSVTNNDAVKAKSEVDAYNVDGTTRHEQTIVLTVTDRSKLPDAKTNFSIKKVSAAASDKNLAGATFSVTNTTAKTAAVTSSATGSDGLTSVDGAKVTTLTPQTLKIQETGAPDGYQLNKTTYYAQWTLGKGFTAVSTDASKTPTATTSEDGVVSVDSDGHLVFGDKEVTKAQSNMAIKKVDQNGDPLAQSKFYVSEPSDGVSDPITKGTTAATAADGMTYVTVPTSSTATRIVRVTETQSKPGYQVDHHAYYAKWQKGVGFTAVTAGDADGNEPSDKADPTATSAANATVDAAGDLVIKNDPTTTYTGKPRYQFRYINAAGAGVGGAALPAAAQSIVNSLDPNQYYDGLQSLILNPTSDPTAFMDAGTVDNSIPGFIGVSGGSAATSTQTSDADGNGVVQPLWTDEALPVNPTGNFVDIVNAVNNGYLLEAGLNYYVQNPAMKKRAAAGTAAYDYYNSNGSITLSDPNDTGTIKVKTDGLNAAKASGNTASVILDKVKHLQVKDTDGNLLAGYTVTFKNTNGDVLKAVTTSTGAAEILPTDETNFAWPKGTVALDAITDPSGKTVTPQGSDGTTGDGGDLSLDRAADTLSFSAGNTGAASISADGQTVQYTVKAQPHFKMQVGNQIGNGIGTVKLAGATFTIKDNTTGETYTDVKSDAQGLVDVQLKKATTSAHELVVTETKAPDGYATFDKSLTISWDTTHGATAVDGGNTADLIGNGYIIANDADGVLKVGQAQRLVMTTSALADIKQNIPLDFGATANFSLQEYDGTTKVGDALPAYFYGIAGTGSSYGLAGLNFFIDNTTNTQDLTKVRTFAVTMKKGVKFGTSAASAKYLTNAADKTYYVRWSAAQGVLSVGTSLTAINATATADGVASVQANQAQDPAPIDTTDRNVLNLGFDQQYTINTQAPGASGTTANVDAKVVLAKGAKTLTATTTDGTGSVTGQQLINLLGGLPTTSDAQSLTVYAQGADAKSADSAHGTFPYNGVDPQTVTFSYKDGFAATGDDGQVTAADGALTLNFRRYVVRAQELADAESPLASATFQLKVTDANDVVKTATVTTDGSGTVQLPDPLALFGPDSDTPGQEYTATLTQTAGSDDYPALTSPISLTYTPEYGYRATSATGLSTVTTDLVTQAPNILDQQNAQAYTWSNTADDVTTQTVNTFTRAGSAVGTQIIYAVPEKSSVAFANVADSNDLNFGNHEISSVASSANVENAGSTNLAGTVPTTVFQAAETAPLATLWASHHTLGEQAFGFQVQQIGSLPDGWHVDLTAGKLATADQDDSSTAGSAITFANGVMAVQPGASATTVQDTTANSTTAATHTIGLGDSAGSADKVLDAHDGANVAGLYAAFWNTKDIKLSLPGLAGSDGVNKVYSANLTWTLVQGTATEQ